MTRPLYLLCFYFVVLQLKMSKCNDWHVSDPDMKQNAALPLQEIVHIILRVFYENYVIDEKIKIYTA